MTLSNILSSADQGENMIASKTLDEKENNVGNSKCIDVSGKSSGDVFNEIGSRTAVTDPSLTALRENNNNIIDQSKKFVGFLGGSIMTALNNQGAFTSKKWLDSNNNNNPPSNDHLNTVGLQTTLPITSSHQVDEESPVSQPKQKYWETFMLPSDDSDIIVVQDDEQDDNESPPPSSQSTKKEAISALISPREKKSNEIYANNGSPESTISIPGDYSPGGSTFSIQPTPNTMKVTNREENSPESLLCNMISAATTRETPLALKSALGPLQDESDLVGDEITGNGYSPKIKGITTIGKTSPECLMSNMISTKTSSEIPLVSKSNGDSMQSLDNSIGYKEKHSAKSMASIREDDYQEDQALQTTRTRGENSLGSSMYEVVSSATNLENPAVPINRQDGILPPVVSKSGSSIAYCNTSNTALTSKQESNRENHVRVAYERKNSKKEDPSASGDSDYKSMDNTPVKSNKSQVFRSSKSLVSLESNCDQSEDGSIYTSLSYQSTIRSVVPLEWVGPDTSNEVTLTASTVVATEKISEVQGRRFRLTKPPTMPVKAGKHLNTSQIKTKSKSSCWVPRLRQVGGTSSPTSLPSLLGAASLNEVSDLESPNIIMPTMNFKFSDEESTIQSQSINEASVIYSVPCDERLQRAPSPHSLMTVDIDEQTLGSRADEYYSQSETATNGDPKTMKHRHLTTIVSTITSRDSGCSRSTMTDQSFEQGRRNKASSLSKWLRMCISLGMIVAICGGITVLVVSLTDRAKPNEPNRQPTRDQDWTSNIDFRIPDTIDLSVPTISPTGTFSPSVEGTYNDTEFPSSFTNSPTPYPTLQPENWTTSSPEITSKPTTTLNSSLKPTSASVTTAYPSLKPTSDLVKTAGPSLKPTPDSLKTAGPSPNPTLRPVKTIEPSTKPTSSPAKTAEPSSKSTSDLVKTAGPSLKPTPDSLKTAGPSPNPTLRQVKTIEPSTKPTSSPAKTAEPSSKSTSDLVKTAGPSLKPTPDSLKTAGPSPKPTLRPVKTIEPSTKPTSSPAKTAEPSSKSSADLVKTAGPSLEPTLDSLKTAGPSPKPTSRQVKTIEPSTKPTSSPVRTLKPSTKPTSKQNLQFEPSSVPTAAVEQSLRTDSPSPLHTTEPLTEPTSKPTLKPSSKPVILPTFATEKLQELTWDRTVKGEDIWREAVDRRTKKPLWYFAADDTTGMKIKVINAARGDRLLNQLRVAVDDYGESKAISSLELTTIDYEFLCTPPAIGHIKVCSGDFGYEWIGSSILFMRGDYIVSALIRINEHASSPAGDALLQYSLCHQFGHALGIAHNTVGGPLSSCMKDFGENTIVDGKIIQNNEKLQHPNSSDLESLVTLYGPAGTRRLRGGNGHV